MLVDLNGFAHRVLLGRGKVSRESCHESSVCVPVRPPPSR
jgi:hypothetical protein